MVLGAHGMLGTAVVHVLTQAGHRVRAVDRTQFDAARDSVRRLNLSGVDYVVNALGLINRRTTTEAENFYLVNSVFPRVLADTCAARGIRLLHISTDCVFDGHDGPYTEVAETTATDLYGRSKALGEPANALVIRTSIIGPEFQHLYSLLAWFMSQSGSCPGYTNHLWNGMSTLQLSRVIDQIMQLNLYCHGVRHVFSNDVSKYELLCWLREAYQRDITITPSGDTVAKDNRLRTVYPDFMARLTIPDLRSQLAELPAVSDALGRWRIAVLTQSLTEQTL